MEIFYLALSIVVLAMVLAALPTILDKHRQNRNK